MLKSKIHRATVTAADLHYVGSISIDPVLLEAADILEHEQVTVLDVDNGARFETYAIVGGPGEICLNGAAARLVQVGDTVILLTYGDYEEPRAGVPRATGGPRRPEERGDRRPGLSPPGARRGRPFDRPAGTPFRSPGGDALPIPVADPPSGVEQVEG